jgi:acetolactate synthase I/II/III large subunit
MARQGIDRRSFLKGAAATAAAAIGTQLVQTKAQAAAATDGDAKETSAVKDKVIARPGSDFMVDVIKATGIEYIASNPGSSFRSLQESIVNYGGNKKPEFLTCMHEESSVAMAHGYAKAAGKPMGILAHGTVGLQHATMAVYNAWCDRVPIKLAPTPVSYSRFTSQVRAPRQNMPAYRKEFVSDQEVADIYAYLASMKPSPAAKDLPLPNF